MMQHHFNVEIAAEYGMLEAVLIDNLFFWIKHNEANDTHFHDGRYWTFNSIKAFAKLFPYASERKLRYALDRLRDEGIIQTGNYNTSAYDKTLWYAFTDKGETLLQNYRMDSAILSKGDDKNVKSYTDINNYKSIYTDINNTDVYKRPTLKEIQDYCEERNSSVDPKYFFDYFNTSGWIDSEGKPVRNWKQKLITWEKRDNERKPNNGKPVKTAKEWNIHYDNE